jgi:hypothetical protein
MSHLVSSSTLLAFLSNMNEKRKSASPIAIQVKNRRKTIGTQEKLHTISQREKGERIVDICHDVRLAHSGIHILCVARLPWSHPNEPYQKLRM